MEYLSTTAKKNYAVHQFALQLKGAFDKFEEKKQVPIVMINKKGQYLFD
jgi:hypothetical protein